MRALPAIALCHFHVDRQLCRCGGPHASRPCGHGAPHTFHALRDRAETRQKRRSSHGANRFEGLPRTFRALRSAGGEGGDQFQYGEEDDRGVEDNFAIG